MGGGFFGFVLGVIAGKWRCIVHCVVQSEKEKKRVGESRKKGGKGGRDKYILRGEKYEVYISWGGFGWWSGRKEMMLTGSS